MRFMALLLGAALLWVQGQMWFGPQSNAHVAQLREALTTQQTRNEQTRVQLQRLRAELKDLREGLEMVEEKARGELGMLEPDEIFVKLP